MGSLGRRVGLDRLQDFLPGLHQFPIARQGNHASADARALELGSGSHQNLENAWSPVSRRRNRLLLIGPRQLRGIWLPPPHLIDDFWGDGLQESCPRMEQEFEKPEVERLTGL